MNDAIAQLIESAASPFARIAGTILSAGLALPEPARTQFISALRVECGRAETDRLSASEKRLLGALLASLP